MKIEEQFKQENGKFVCPFCSKLYKKMGIKGHIWRYHTDEGKNFNPNGEYSKGTRTAWNKGLSKETDERVKKIGEKFSKNNKGRIFSEEHKKNISKGVSNYLKQNSQNHTWSSSYQKKETEPEKKFRETIEKTANIEFTQYYKPEESNRQFEIDFAVVSDKIGFEINGNQHYNRDGTLAPYYQERHDYLEGLGWKILEIHYSICFNQELIENLLKQSLENIEIAQNKCNSILDGRIKRQTRRKEERDKLKIKRDNDRRMEKEKKDKEKINVIMSIINSYGNKYGIINQLSQELNVSHTQIRRLLNKYNIDIKTRKDSSN